MLNKKIFFQVALLVLFAFVLFYVRLDRVYEEAYDEYLNFVPSEVSTGFSLRRVDKNVSLDENTAAIVLSVRPGETFEGSFLVKNHELRPAGFSLLSHGFNPFGREDLTDEELEGLVLPTLELEQNSFDLESKEWILIDYVLTVPEDMELGQYQNLVSLTLAQRFDYQKGVNLAYGVGVNMNVEVTDKPQDYQYTRIIGDYSVEELAREEVKIEMKKILGVGFAILAIFFFYKAFTADGKKKKKGTKSKKKK